MRIRQVAFEPLANLHRKNVELFSQTTVGDEKAGAESKNVNDDMCLLHLHRICQLSLVLLSKSGCLDHP